MSNLPPNEVSYNQDQIFNFSVLFYVWGIKRFEKAGQPRTKFSLKIAKQSFIFIFLVFCLQARMGKELYFVEVVPLSTKQLSVFK